MRRCSLLLLCVACCGFYAACGDETRVPPVGSGSTPAEDAEDAGDEQPVLGPMRGAEPVWPQAEDEIVLPFRGGDVTTELSITADLSQLDIHMNVDTTASIDEEIDALQRSLRTTLVTKLSSRIEDVSFGVSRFADFAIAPFGVDSGSSVDRPFVLLTPITSSLSRVASAVAVLDNPLGFGGDEAEAGAESLYQVATGDGYTSKNKTLIKPWNHDAAEGGGTIGGVGFRELALRVVLHVTDAPSHFPAEYTAQGLKGTHSMQEAADALRALSARAIAIMSTDCRDARCRKNESYQSLRRELSDLALTTKAVMEPDHGTCPTGIEGEELPTYEGTCPLVFDVRSDGTGLATTVVDAVLGLLDGLRFSEVHAEIGADPLGLVQSVEAVSVAQEADVVAPKHVDRLPSGKHDGIDDTFVSVPRRALLGFRVTLRNDRLAPSDQPQRYRVSIRVIGDGIALEERTLRLVVPAASTPRPEPKDAGSMSPTSDAAPAPDDDAGQ